jgi:hypothetical protein
VRIENSQYSDTPLGLCLAKFQRAKPVDLILDVNPLELKKFSFSKSLHFLSRKKERSPLLDFPTSKSPIKAVAATIMTAKINSMLAQPRAIRVDLPHGTTGISN